MILVFLLPNRISSINGSSKMTSSNGNIFCVTGHLCGEFTGPQWIPQHKGQWRGALTFSLICVWINGWVNNVEAGDLIRYRAHHYVTVMISMKIILLYQWRYQMGGDRDDIIKWKHFPRHWSFVRWIALTNASDAGLWCFLSFAPEQTVEQTI